MKYRLIKSTDVKDFEKQMADLSEENYRPAGNVTTGSKVVTDANGNKHMIETFYLMVCSESPTEHDSILVGLGPNAGASVDATVTAQPKTTAAKKAGKK